MKKHAFLYYKPIPNHQKNTQRSSYQKNTSPGQLIPINSLSTLHHKRTLHNIFPRQLVDTHTQTPRAKVSFSLCRSAKRGTKTTYAPLPLATFKRRFPDNTRRGSFTGRREGKFSAISRHVSRRFQRLRAVMWAVKRERQGREWKCGMTREGLGWKW